MHIRISILLFLLITFNRISSAQSFYFGNDVSYLNEMQDCGVNFKENGESKDVLDILKDHGCNLVRLRIWHTPTWYDGLNLGNRYGDLEDVILASFYAKSRGLPLLLDFQLSDTWADPSHQVVPAAWANVVDDLPVLQDSLYQYIYKTLTLFTQAGLTPEIVQIGNETNRGILLSQQVNDQGWSVNWPRNAALFNSAIAAVRDVETDADVSIKVALHIADPSELNWWMNQFWTNGVQDFDIIGMSYYHEYHQDLIADVGNVISNMKATYPGKEVMILETAYPWTSNFDDGANNLLHTVYPGYPFSPQNQKQWLIDLTQTVIDHGGSGVVYWEPDWVSTSCQTQYGTGSNWENSTFFDFNDNLLNDGGIGWMTHTYDFGTSVNKITSDSFHLQVVLKGDEIWLYDIEKVSSADRLDVEIFSMDGKMIWKEEIEMSGGRCKVSMGRRSSPEGIYYFRITGKYGSHMNQLVPLM